MSKKKYKKKEYSKKELRDLYEKDPHLWLYITSKGQYGNPPKKKKA